MGITELRFSGYRAFPRDVRIALKPLTVLIGKNSAGKSSILRLLPLLEQSLRPVSRGQVSAIDLRATEADLGWSFEDLLTGKSPHGTLNVGCSCAVRGSEHEISLDAEVQNFSEVNRNVTTRLRLQDATEWVSIELRGLDVDAETAMLDYATYGSRAAERIDRRRPGLLPQAGFMGEQHSSERTLRRALHMAYPRTRYIGPYRDVPDRIYRVGRGSDPGSVGSRGQFIYEILADTRRPSHLIEVLNRQMAPLLGSLQFQSTPIAREMVSLQVIDPHRPGMALDVADLGAGVAQALPVYLQAAVDLGSKNILHVIEQPELHLHPALHGEVADLHIEFQESGGQAVIETHSENYLLRLRRRVAEGKLRAADLALYYVEAGTPEPVKEIKVLDNGSVQWWPKGVFQEELEEVKALNRAQLLTKGDR